ncbi:hypothetical protein [Caballeronia sp. ATUFL_M2_KS44]|uniref:hypothetical protein n=1 Tax=Caballeronia sp. ATUFL_M2_KS44 TaxID=2921767 RepID=UPI002027BC6B|nr:hypothetical protein [Caballeronia sp. ATUFL_M2_KS44]
MPTIETRGICTARPNPSVLKPFEQIVGELNPDRRNKVFQVVTRIWGNVIKHSRANSAFVVQMLSFIQGIYSVVGDYRQNAIFWVSGL